MSDSRNDLAIALLRTVADTLTTAGKLSDGILAERIKDLSLAVRLSLATKGILDGAPSMVLIKPAPDLPATPVMADAAPAKPAAIPDTPQSKVLMGAAGPVPRAPAAVATAHTEKPAEVVAAHAPKADRAPKHTAIRTEAEQVVSDVAQNPVTLVEMPTKTILKTVNIVAGQVGVSANKYDRTPHINFLIAVIPVLAKREQKTTNFHDGLQILKQVNTIPASLGMDADMQEKAKAALLQAQAVLPKGAMRSLYLRSDAMDHMGIPQEDRPVTLPAAAVRTPKPNGKTNGAVHMPATNGHVSTIAAASEIIVRPVAASASAPKPSLADVPQRTAMLSSRPTQDRVALWPSVVHQGAGAEILKRKEPVPVAGVRSAMATVPNAPKTVMELRNLATSVYDAAEAIKDGKPYADRKVVNDGLLAIKQGVKVKGHEILDPMNGKFSISKLLMAMETLHNPSVNMVKASTQALGVVVRIVDANPYVIAGWDYPHTTVERLAKGSDELARHAKKYLPVFAKIKREQEEKAIAEAARANMHRGSPVGMPSARYS